MNGQQTLRKAQQAVAASPAGAGKDLLESVLREAKANVSANKMKGKKRKHSVRYQRCGYELTKVNSVVG